MGRRNKLLKFGCLAGAVSLNSKKALNNQDFEVEYESTAYT